MSKTIMLYYSGPGRDPHGMPTPLYSYFVAASPWDDHSASGIATIVSLGDAPRCEKQHVVQSGGEDAAIASAEAHLDNLHAGLKKTRG